MKLILGQNTQVMIKKYSNGGGEGLVLAAQNGHDECVKLLLEHITEFQTYHILRAIDIAEAYGHPKCKKLISTAYQAYRSSVDKKAKMLASLLNNITTILS